MVGSDTLEISESLLKTFLDDERFWPAEPRTLAETGLPAVLIESLICKHLAVTGNLSGRAIAERICLPFRILEDIYATLRTRQIVVHSGSAPFNDYYFSLTESGHERARMYQRACAYVGPAPVPLVDYVSSVEAQCISTESPTIEDLAQACSDISIDEKLFDLVGPAVNSGAGMFLFGSPGNGKSTLANRITTCFGQETWIPRTIVEDDQLIKLFDSSYHRERSENKRDILKDSDYDKRWVRIRRPTVTVGGELTMANLEIQHDPVANISEAPLQLKSNGGCLLIDDFGRQRLNPAELLNRWIIPLECGHDFLTLSTGKKIKVPFEQLIIFSTNLEPRALVDEAFLRRIPYKIEISDPDESEFYRLFELYSKQFGCAYRPDSVRYLLETHYRQTGRAMRRCHPRDLLKQVRNYCRYKRLPVEMKPEYFDRVVNSYFAVIFGEDQSSSPPWQRSGNGSER
jgi:predicted ATPase with chaperone activity